MVHVGVVSPPGSGLLRNASDRKPVEAGRFASSRPLSRRRNKLTTDRAPAPRAREDFLDRGWLKFAFDPLLAEWARCALPAARAAVRDAGNARWLRCGGTWFAGVGALPNDARGAVEDGPPLAGAALDFLGDALGVTGVEWDRAQVSVCYPGYPRRMDAESRAAHRYRRERDAAHVDGLLPEGAARRRRLREHHGFILGIPMVETDPGAAPFVVWEGSHRVVRETFLRRFEGVPASRWRDVDVTDVYHAARRRIFDACERVEIAARPGEAYLAHRLILHGVAPWAESARASGDGRMICYFRPEIGGPLEWLTGD